MALWEVARLSLTPSMAYAVKLGRKSASSGSWSRLVAVLRGFGLVRVEGDQIGLSQLGQELVNVSNPAQQMAARRTAVLRLKAYRELVESFDGTTLPDQPSLAARLKFEYGKKNDFAEEAAKAFLDSLVFAEMIDSAGVVRKNGADAAHEAPPEDDEDEQAELIDDAFDDAAADHTEDDEIDFEAVGENRDAVGSADSDKVQNPEWLAMSGPAQVTISVSLDLSKYRADEVIQILRTLNG